MTWVAWGNPIAREGGNARGDWISAIDTPEIRVVY